MTAAAPTPDLPSTAACAACAVTPAAELLARHAERERQATLLLALPGLDGTTGLSRVERRLKQVPGVHGARVNLTLRHVAVTGHPEVTADSLVAALAEIGVAASELDPDTIAVTHSDRQGRELLMRLGVAGFAAMNVMLLSVAVWSGAEGATRDMFHWISAGIALPAIVFCGQPFFRSAFAGLKARQLNMDVPISLAIVLASTLSLYETAHSGEHAYFDAAIMLTFFLLAGRYLDHRTRAVARSAAQELAALELPRATRRTADGGEETVALSLVHAGDTILVRPGGRMPVDGEVLEGESEIDRSLLTGETLPVRVGPGAHVSAGEVNLTGPLALRATAVGRDSSLHALTDLVAVAESGRANYKPLADRAARLYSPGVHVLAAMAFAWWYVTTHDVRLAVNIAAATLIITCPCALALAVPAVTTAASGRLFRRGLLIKSATALERLAEADVVVFDKTGTLTAGTPTLDAAPDRSALALAAAVAAGSSHPLAMALVAAARAEGVTPAVATAIREVPGYGIEAEVDGQPLRLGRGDWVGAGAAEERLATTWLRVGDAAPVVFRFTDRLRPGAAETVAALRAAGLKVRLMSGDSAPAVAAIAGQLGIDDWTARATPQDKAATVAALGQAGQRVLMVGDGLNDTAALAAAHVSVAPASALDAARVASDMVLLGADLTALAEARAVAVRATRRIRENFALAFAYNGVAVPLAVAGLVTPLIAALAMSSSSILVSLNALRVAPPAPSVPRSRAMPTAPTGTAYAVGAE
jgi:Cu2+-exporting ATPase